MKFWLAALVITHLSSECIFAHQPKEGKVTSTIAPFIYKTDFDKSDAGATSPYLGGWGFIVEGDANKNGGLEIGLFHMNKLFIREEAKKYIAEKTQVVHVTMGYRWWMGRYWSFSPAFYSAYSMGDVQVVHNDFTSGKEIDTSARDFTEYGFDFSTQYEFSSQDPYFWVIDVRYSRSVTAKDHEFSNHYGILIGFKYLVQEKEPPQKEDRPTRWN
ncbi:MAG: hypothetical protein AB7O96_14050 [Pseudobdellovibrionaceae bacterium]